WKVLKVFQPECGSSDYGGVVDKISNQENVHKISIKDEVRIIPNPVTGNEIKIVSKFAETKFEIYDSKGQRFLSDSFKGDEYVLKTVNLNSGMYFLTYNDGSKNSGQLVFVKQ